MSGLRDEVDVLIEAAVYRSHATVARLVTARKRHSCAFSRDVSWARGCRDVTPGEQYVRITTFPGHDVVETTVPITGACCLACASGYIGIEDIVPKEARRL